MKSKVMGRSSRRERKEAGFSFCLLCDFLGRLGLGLRTGLGSEYLGAGASAVEAEDAHFARMDGFRELRG